MPYDDEPELHPNCTANINGLELTQASVAAVAEALYFYVSHDMHHAAIAKALHEAMCEAPLERKGAPNDHDVVVIIVKNTLQALFRAEANPANAARQIEDAVTLLSAYAGDLGVPRAEIAKWADEAGLHYTTIESEGA